MSDFRNAPRNVARHRGKAVISGRSEVACSIRDLSATGARLSFMNPTILPRTFRLVFDKEDHRVTVVWQAGLLAGVRFQAPLRHLAPRKKKTWPWSRR